MVSCHPISSVRFARRAPISLSVAILIGLAGCSDSGPMSRAAPPSATGPVTTAGGLAGDATAGAGGATGGGTTTVVGPAPGGGGTGGLPESGAPARAEADGGATDASGSGDGGLGDANATLADGSVAQATDGGSGGAAACTRELLQSTVDHYFVALAAHDSSKLPLANNAKFTENGVTMAIGMGGMWRTAGMLKYEHSALDVKLCTSASQAVVPEGQTDLPFALRLKLVNGKIAEIEHIVVREGDYTILGLIPFPSNPADIIASANRVQWKQPVSTADRTPRADMERWADKYFKMFPSGGCHLAPNCERRENGGGDFNCADALSCASKDPPASSDSSDPRLVVVDEDLGIAVAFAMFLGHTDMHMAKFRAGTVYAVHAILSAAKGPGWP